MTSGVRVLQRGGCGAAWRDSSRPAWPQPAGLVQPPGERRLPPAARRRLSAPRRRRHFLPWRALLARPATACQAGTCGRRAPGIGDSCTSWPPGRACAGVFSREIAVKNKTHCFKISIQINLSLFQGQMRMFIWSYQPRKLAFLFPISHEGKATDEMKNREPTYRTPHSIPPLSVVTEHYCSSKMPRHVSCQRLTIRG
jgi:hypothetical protein